MKFFIAVCALVLLALGGQATARSELKVKGGYKTLDVECEEAKTAVATLVEVAAQKNIEVGGSSLNEFHVESVSMQVVSGTNYKIVLSKVTNACTGDEPCVGSYLTRCTFTLYVQELTNTKEIKDFSCIA